MRMSQFLCTGTPNFPVQGNLHKIPVHLPIAANGLQVPPFRAPSAQPIAQTQPAQRQSTHPERDHRNPTTPTAEVINRQRAARLQSQVSAQQNKVASKRVLIEEADKLLAQDTDGEQPSGKDDRTSYMRLKDLYNRDKQQLAKLEERLRVAQLQCS